MSQSSGIVVVGAGVSRAVAGAAEMRNTVFAPSSDTTSRPRPSKTASTGRRPLGHFAASPSCAKMGAVFAGVCRMGSSAFITKYFFDRATLHTRAVSGMSGNDRRKSPSLENSTTSCASRFAT